MIMSRAAVKFNFFDIRSVKRIDRGTLSGDAQKSED